LDLSALVTLHAAQENLLVLTPISQWIYGLSLATGVMVEAVFENEEDEGI